MDTISIISLNTDHRNVDMNKINTFITTCYENQTKHIKNGIRVIYLPVRRSNLT